MLRRREMHFSLQYLVNTAYTTTVNSRQIERIALRRVGNDSFWNTLQVGTEGIRGKLRQTDPRPVNT